MWQTIALNNYIDPSLIDNQTVRVNLSAWIGGLNIQDDNAVVSLIFHDQFNHIRGNQTRIGPVLSIDRSNETSLIFLQANSLVPVGTRSFTVFVEMFLIVGTYINAGVDNIIVSLY